MATSESLEEAALFALQKLDRARAHHRELVDATSAQEVRRLGMAVEHDWHLLDDAAEQLRRALHITGDLT